MFGQNFDSSNLSAMSESLSRSEAFTDAEREDFFNAIHNVQVNTTNAYSTLMDIAVAADDLDMIQTMGGLVDQSYMQQGYMQAAYADQLPTQADAMNKGRQEFENEKSKYLTLADLEVSNATVSGTVTESETVQDTFDSLVDRLIPEVGNCDTIGGELLRAVNKLEYRYYNDGDHIGIGYGNEVCNAPARFLKQEGNDAIKVLIDANWSNSNTTEYEAFIGQLKDEVVKYILDNKLDKVSNYKNLDYLDFAEDSDFTYSDDFDESVIVKHTPYYVKEEDDIDMSDTSDVDMGSDIENAGDDVSMSESETITDLIEDTEIHELAPQVNDIVLDKEDAIKGKVLNTHDDNTVDVKWDDDDITRNTSVDDVQIIKPATETYNVYYIKQNNPVKVIETIDPNRAIAVYNGIKKKLPNTECFYVKSGKAEEELLNKYKSGNNTINEEEVIVNDSNIEILNQLQDSLGSVYTTKIEDGQLICTDSQGNFVSILCGIEQPFELSLQVTMADGDTSEVINYMYDGIAPAADFIVAAFSGEVAARDVNESKTIKDECGTVADLGMAPILPASNSKGLVKVVGLKLDDEETKRLLAKLSMNESDPTKEDVVAQLKALQEFSGMEMPAVIDFLPEEQMKVVNKVFGTTNSEEIANEIENMTECKNTVNEDSANFMQFVVDAINKVDGCSAQLDDEQGIHILSGNKKASAFYDPASRSLIAVYPTENGEFTNAEINLKDPKEVATQLLKPITESMNPLKFVPDAPVTALDDKAQFTARQALELSNTDTINNNIQQKLTYRNQQLPPVADVEIKDSKMVAQDKLGYIPLEPVTSDLNQEVFSAAVVAVTDATKLTDNVEAFVKLQELYPNTDAKQLAKLIKEAKESNNSGKLIQYVYESTQKKVESIELVKSSLTDIYDEDTCNSVLDMLKDFDMTQAKDVILFKEQAKLIIEPEDVKKTLKLLGINEDTFIDVKLNDANAQGVKTANGQPIATTNATGNDPVTPTLADDIDPAQVVVNGIPADQSEIDAITGKKPEEPNSEPNFDITQQV